MKRLIDADVLIHELNIRKVPYRRDIEKCIEDVLTIKPTDSDLIRREDAIELANDIVRWTIEDSLPNEIKLSSDYVFASIVKPFIALPSVEVVRCKDCKHYSIEGETTHFGWCGYWNKPTDEMRFCSDGERREDENGKTNETGQGNRSY